MLSTKSLRTALRYVHAINAHDINSIANLLSDQCVFVDNNTDEHPGKETLVRNWGYYLEKWPNVVMLISEIYVQDNQALLIYRATGSYYNLPDIEDFQIARMLHTQVENDRIVMYHFLEYSEEQFDKITAGKWQQVFDPELQAATIQRHLELMSDGYTASIRNIRRYYSNIWKKAPVEKMYLLAEILLSEYGQRYVAYEMLHNHKKALNALNAKQVEHLGNGINSWDTTDTYSMYIVGPAWKNGNVPDSMPLRWAESDSVWWRSTALVSTIYLMGDVERMLRFSEMMVDDHEDMIVKALSWVLRKMVKYDREAVKTFLETYDGRLAARVKREVNNKLRTGLKNPKNS